MTGDDRREQAITLTTVLSRLSRAEGVFENILQCILDVERLREEIRG